MTISIRSNGLNSTRLQFSKLFYLIQSNRLAITERNSALSRSLTIFLICQSLSSHYRLTCLSNNLLVLRLINITYNQSAPESAVLPELPE